MQQKIQTQNFTEFHKPLAPDFAQDQDIYSSHQGFWQE